MKYYLRLLVKIITKFSWKLAQLIDLNKATCPFYPFFSVDYIVPWKTRQPILREIRKGTNYFSGLHQTCAAKGKSSQNIFKINEPL